MKRLGQTAVGTGGGTLIYTVPTGFQADVRDIIISNTTAASIAFTLHLVPSGGSVNANNAMMYAVSIPANTTVHWTGHQMLDATGFIKGIGSASGITVTITGDETR